MSSHFADRLLEAISTKGAPACVGLDPVLDRLPPEVLSEAGIPASVLNDNGSAASPGIPAAIDAILSFGRGVIGAIAAHVPAIKINIAFFEIYGPAGVQAYFDLVRTASDAGLVVIGDIKRADIGHSSMQYARAHLGSPALKGLAFPDAITVNPYFGIDGVRPFIDVARERGRGIFVLVQTSNPSAVEVQGNVLADSGTLCQKVGTLVEQWANEDGLIGECGYSSIGAVVSPRDLESTEHIRSAMPSCLFLVPGFGAQGRTASEVAKCFKKDGTGAIVTASRSVIYAYQSDDNHAASGNTWQQAVERGCESFVAAISSILPTY